MFDLVPGMELTPTNPMTLKPHALKSPAQVGSFTLSFFVDISFIVKRKKKRERSATGWLQKKIKHRYISYCVKLLLIELTEHNWTG